MGSALDAGAASLGGRARRSLRLPADEFVPRNASHFLQFEREPLRGPIAPCAHAENLHPRNIFDPFRKLAIGNFCAVHPVLQSGHGPFVHGVYSDCKSKCTRSDMVAVLGFPQYVHMKKKGRGPGHFIREWRKDRDLTLEALADRVGTTHATLSRVERGKVPYSQPLLEALAEALGTTPASLIMRDPSNPGIWDIWEDIAPAEREQATKVLETFKKRA